MNRRRKRRPRPRTGVYFWVPKHFNNQVAWRLLTCFDLGHNPRAGYIETWPVVVDRIAEAWAWESGALQRYLEG
ncbi:hypothetical protein [Tautonia plasticadhaerens]|uniref:Uncharacterized protein n=1 Tax=Tautonia plasticadhaerens TaxID=2527974 RepID=A0A518H6D7_9BACT|nr:hypothetical protein [Tautonia plasticadhaerens]QDV36407.1 hypothetical protein ElP_43310 [Tautonia plasticadhaerens]